MFDSQTIQMQGTTSTDLYSPWFSRGGDYGLFTVEVVAIGGGGTVTMAVAMIQKNASDTGDGSGLSGVSAISRTTAGRTTKDFQAGVDSSAFAGFKELVRYKFTISGGSSGVTSWATFRMLPPTWYDKV